MTDLIDALAGLLFLHISSRLGVLMYTLERLFGRGAK